MSAVSLTQRPRFFRCLKCGAWRQGFATQPHAPTQIPLAGGGGGFRVDCIGEAIDEHWLPVIGAELGSAAA